MTKVVKGLAAGAVLVALGLSGMPARAEQGRNAAAAVGAAAGFALGAAAASQPRPRAYYPGPQSFSVYEDDPAECRVVTRRVCDGYGCRTRRTEVCD
jgi:outer membrane lipoprotein SlyB